MLNVNANAVLRATLSGGGVSPGARGELLFRIATIASVRDDSFEAGRCSPPISRRRRRSARYCLGHASVGLLAGYVDPFGISTGPGKMSEFDV
jgi:hypothetical protein